MPILTLHPSEPRIDIETAWADRELIKTIPGVRWDSTRKVWTVPRSWAACLQLRTTFGKRLEIGPDVAVWAAGEKKRVTENTALAKVIDQPEGDPRLHPFQRADEDFLTASADGAILGNDMGTGKTVSTLVSSALLPAVVICPNSTKHNWAKEAGIWFPGASPYVLEGTATKRAKILAAAAADPSALVIVSYETARTHSRLAPYGSVRLKRCTDCGGGDETVKTSACEAHAKDLNTIPFRTVVVDEAHRLKDPKAKQTRACWAIAHGPTVEHRFALTGTPIVNHVGDLWSIGHLIAQHEYPVRSSFIERYALQNWNSFGGMDIIGIRPDTREELFGFFDARFRRMTKAEVLTQLPPKVRQVRLADMSTKMTKAYRELEAELVTKLDDGSILFAPSSLTASLRLLQLSSSYGEINEAGQYLLMDKPSGRSPKLDVMEEILEELGDKQVAVCALSRQLIDLAAARLDAAGISYGIITGTVSTVDRQRYLEEFQAGKRRVMLFTVQAGGVGLTMTAADTIVFLQRSWSIVDNKQAEDRVHRIGSEVHESVTIIDVVAPDTIEVKQIARLHEKLRVLDEVTRDGTMSFDNDDDLRGML